MQIKQIKRKIDEYGEGLTITQRNFRQYRIDKQGKKIEITLCNSRMFMYNEETIEDVKKDFDIDNDFVMTGRFPTKWGLKFIFYKKNLSKGGAE